jgi:hypothetical protein
MQINQQFNGASVNDNLSERNRKLLHQMEVLRHLQVNKNGFNSKNSSVASGIEKQAVEIPNHYFFSADDSIFSISTKKRLLIVPNAPLSMMPSANKAPHEHNKIFSGFSMFPRGNGSLMDIGHLQSRTEPSMSDEEFFEVARDLARIDAAKGIIDSDEFRSLMTDFISVVSPDRQSIVAKGVKSMGLPFDMSSAVSISNLEVKEGNQVIAHYASGHGRGWTKISTPAELARHVKLTEVYTQAWTLAGGSNTAVNAQMSFNRTA